MAAGKNFKLTNKSFLVTEEGTKKTILLFFMLSLFLHIVFSVGILFLQDFKLPKKLPPVIQVDLVSFAPEVALNEPAKTEKTASESGGITPVKKVEPPKKTIKHIKPDISLKQKPKNLKELLEKAKKKEKVKPKKKPEKKPKKKKAQPQKEPENTNNQEKEKELEKAKEELEKEIEANKQQQIAEAMERLKREIQNQEKTQAEGTGGKGSGKPGYKPIDLYHVVIASRVEQNWVFNDILARMDKDLEVRLIVKILKSGEIRDIIYETRSGNRYLDESAKRAIKKSSPFPSLPGNRRSYDFGLIFTPRGLK